MNSTNIYKSGTKILCSIALFVASAISYATGVLLQPNDITYIGAFRLPEGTFGCSNGEACVFNYAGRGIGYNPANNSLYVSGHVYNEYLAEINIPTLINSTNIKNLNTATIKQNFTNVWSGSLGRLGPGGSYIENGGQTGGILVNGSKIVISQYAYYDGGFEAVLSHATVNSNWSGGVGFSGMKTVGGTSANVVGQTAGYMTWIPSDWRTRMGGPALTGIANIAIISRSSFGPSAWVFDPNKIGTVNPVPAVQVVGYPNGHWTLGDWSGVNNYIGGSDWITAVVWPEGSDTVLFYGRHGDTNCYGGGPECGDPTDPYKGSHGYPYHTRIWAYNANDLLAVKNGTKNPWDLKPYWMYNFEGQLNGFIGGTKIILGATYDASKQIIYVSADHGDGSIPVIHAFQVHLPVKSTVLPPPAIPNPPEDLSVQ